MVCLYFNIAGHLAIKCDVSSEQEVQNAFEEMQRNLGPINYLVNAAGINRLVTCYKIICNSRLTASYCKVLRGFALTVLLMSTSENRMKCLLMFCS